jgi:hypothetical protein
MNALLVDRGSIVEKVPLMDAWDTIEKICLWDGVGGLSLILNRSRISLKRGDRVALHEGYVHGMPSYKIEMDLMEIGLPVSVFGLFKEKLESQPQRHYINFGRGHLNGDKKVLSGSEKSDSGVRRLLLTPLGENYRYEDASGFVMNGRLISKYLDFRPLVGRGPGIGFVEDMGDDCYERCFFHVHSGAWNPLR